MSQNKFVTTGDPIKYKTWHNNMYLKLPQGYDGRHDT